MELNEHGLPPGYRFRPDVEITPRRARELLRQGEMLLLDCRREEEYARARIEGGLLLPMHELLERVEEIGDKERPVVVYCHHGVRSLYVTVALRKLGFRDVRSLAGGIELWSLDIDPSVPRY